MGSTKPVKAGQALLEGVGVEGGQACGVRGEGSLDNRGCEWDNF